MKKRKSIRIRLLEVYVVIMLLVFAINMYIVHSQSQAIRQIDGVYNSNIQLNDISTTLEKMQTSLYQYLNTKSSDELENYYLYEQDYRNLISELNEETVNDQNLLMEKNIRNMSDTYLEKTAGAIEAKRGRNVSCRHFHCDTVFQFLGCFLLGATSLVAFLVFLCLFHILFLLIRLLIQLYRPTGCHLLQFGWWVASGFGTPETQTCYLPILKE